MMRLVHLADSSTKNGRKKIVFGSVPNGTKKIIIHSNLMKLLWKDKYNLFHHLVLFYSFQCFSYSVTFLQSLSYTLNHLH